MKEVGWSGNVKKYLAIGILIGIAAYIVIFAYVYKGNFIKFIDIVAHGNPVDAFAAFLLRILVSIVHATVWFFVIYALRKVDYVKVLSITGVALFFEVIVPIGGVTEVVKILLTIKLRLLSKEEAIASLLIHRVLTSLGIIIVTIISLLAIKASLATCLGLLIPAAILLSMNIGLCLVPTSKRIERLLNRYGGRFGYNFEGLSYAYIEKLIRIRRAVPFILIAFTFAILERLVNGFYGIFTASLIGTHITLPVSLLTFDTIYAILWLFPVVTPGQLGIYEFIQTGILSHLGISLDEAAAMSIISRVIYVLGGYVVFAVFITLLGLSVRSLIAELSASTAGKADSEGS
ncbi:MAG: flippase-like domain-containing protein [Desulfurococcales archaeon]|nr:flippase-like domain-containing protein [Desulfurococcales archaeon]